MRHLFNHQCIHLSVDFHLYYLHELFLCVMARGAKGLTAGRSENKDLKVSL